MTHEQCIKWSLEAAKNDCVALWRIVGYASHDTGIYEADIEPLGLLPIANSVEVKAKTLSLVRDLLNTRCLQVGELADGASSIVAWRIPVAAVIERIDREWSSLGKEPDMEHDICWFGECDPQIWPHGR